MKFKKLRKILGDGKIMICIVLERNMVESTTNTIIFGNVSIVPTKYDDYDVIDIDVQVTDDVYSKITIRMDTSPKKFGELRKYVYKSTPVSISLRSKLGEVISCPIDGVPIEYNDYDIIMIRSIYTDNGFGHEIEFYLDDVE